MDETNNAYIFTLNEIIRLITFTGEYWLDPNGGTNEDAFQVHCNFAGYAETCIEPTTVFEMKKWSTAKNNKYNWIGKDVEEETAKVSIPALITTVMFN